MKFYFLLYMLVPKNVIFLYESVLIWYIFSQLCGYHSACTLAPEHQLPQCWVCTHAFSICLWVKTTVWCYTAISHFAYDLVGCIIQDVVTGIVHKLRHSFKSSPPGAAYIRQWTVSTLVQVMVCCLFGTKPLPEPMLSYCQMNNCPGNKF